MAEIKKIKVDGVEYDIGSNLGAELEWKLITTGTYYSEDKNKALIYLLEENLEPDKMYYIERYDANMGDILYCFMPTYYDESYEEVQTKGTCLMKAYETDTDALIDVRVMLSGGDSNKTHLKIISPSNTISLYHDDDDYIKVYELAIKNVENPSNVVTPNKMKLVATGTWNNDNNCFNLDNKLEWGKTYLYNIEFDPASQNMSGVLPLFNSQNYEEYQIFCSGAVYEISEDEIIAGRLCYTSNSNNIKMFYDKAELIEGPLDLFEDLKIYIYELPFTL